MDCVARVGSKEEGAGMGWPPVNSARTRGQLLGCGDRLGRYCLLIFIAQRTKLSGRKHRLGHVPHVLHSESIGPRLVIQTGRFRQGTEG